MVELLLGTRFDQRTIIENFRQAGLEFTFALVTNLASKFPISLYDYKVDITLEGKLHRFYIALNQLKQITHIEERIIYQ